MNLASVSRTSRIFICALCACVLVACAETEFLIHTTKIFKGKTTDRSGGRYKIGNPYEIYGTWYYPAVDYDYDETGIASWYGPKFHGKQTANGEKYDMDALTAAHRTLPLPTWVEVTNLENGRKLKLRINDRGPYAKGRIIDISRQGAQLLGFKSNGTAKVRVKVLAKESRRLAAQLKSGGTVTGTDSPITVDSLPATSVDAEPLVPPDGAVVAEAPIDNSVDTPVKTADTAVIEPVSSATNPASDLTSDEVQIVPVADTGIFVQAGAFSRFDNANRVQAILASVGEVNISQVLVNNTDLYRVRVGPISNVAEADQILSQVIGAGYPDARVIVD